MSIQFDAYMAGAAARDAAARQKLAAIHASGKTAVEWALEQIEAAAIRGQIETVKRRARGYIRRPANLNALDWNLSQASAHDGLRRVERLLREEPCTSAFPANIPATNLMAARLGFRWLRRAERNGRLEELLFAQAAE